MVWISCEWPSRVGMGHIPSILALHRHYVRYFQFGYLWKISLYHCQLLLLSFTHIFFPSHSSDSLSPGTQTLISSNISSLAATAMSPVPSASWRLEQLFLTCAGNPRINGGRKFTSCGDGSIGPTKQAEMIHDPCQSLRFWVQTPMRWILYMEIWRCSSH